MELNYTQPDGYVHVFVDGGARGDKDNHKKHPVETRTLNVLAGGIVILTDDPSKPIIKHVRTSPNDVIQTSKRKSASDAFSITSEALVAAAAIYLAGNKAPLKLYTDNKDVCSTLAYGSPTNQTRLIQSNPLNLEALKILERAAKSHCLIIPILANRASWVAADPYGQYYMTLAHNASIEARGAYKKKKFKSVTTPDKFTEHDRNEEPEGFSYTDQMRHIKLDFTP